MAADNTTLNAGSGGETFPSLADSNNINWPVGCSAYPTTISAGANVLQLVDLTHGLPIQPQTGSTFAVTGTFWQATQPISAVSLPLPTGAATAANQTTEIASLTSIDGKLPALLGGNVPVTIAGQTGTVTVAVSNTVTVSGTVAISGSVAVTGAFFQATQPVSAVSLPLPTGAATEATLSTLNGKVTACNTGSVTVSSSVLPTGASTAANQSTGNASLASIDGKITACNTGAVVISSGTITTVSTLTQWTAGHGTAAAALRVELPTDGTGVVGLNAGVNSIGTVQPGNTPNTTPWLANESDPAATTGTISAADAATTSTTNNNGQTIITGAPTANSSVSATLNAHSGVTIQLTGTAVASFAFSIERSVDGGTTFVPFSVELVSVGTSSSTWTLTDNNAAVFRGNSGEMTTVRVRCTSKTGTSVAVKIQPGFGTSQVIANQGPPNSNTNAWPVTQTAQTSGGTTTYRNFQTSSAVIAANVKASAGQVYSIECFNIGAAAVYVRLYNQTTSPGTGDTVVWSGIVPGNTAGAGFVKSWPSGMVFGTGIGIRCTSAIADTDNTALSPNTVMINLEYK